MLLELVPSARRFLWIATADLKDLHIKSGSGRFVPFVKTLAQLVTEGVHVRLFHAKEPGPRFRRDFDKSPVLIESPHFERILCPRMHMKVFLVDGKRAYVGSANLTGAGAGAKHADRRNFEAGMLTDDAGAVAQLMTALDRLYLGENCRSCRLRKYCPDPIV